MTEHIVASSALATATAPVPQRWRGHAVPQTIAAWIDQLMEPTTLLIIQTASAARHLDVVLTVSPHRGVTRVPDVIAKGPAGVDKSKKGR